MSGFINQTYDDRDPSITYFPAASWGHFVNADPELGYHANTYTSINASIGIFTFTSPQRAIALYGYGRLETGSFGTFFDCDIHCLPTESDTFASPAGSTRPILLFAHRFEEPGFHSYTLTLREPSVLFFDGIVLEVPVGPTSVTPFNKSSTKTLPLRAIIGGSVGGGVALFGILGFLLWYFCRRKNRHNQPTVFVQGPSAVPVPTASRLPPPQPISFQSAGFVPSQVGTVNNYGTAAMMGTNHVVYHPSIPPSVTSVPTTNHYDIEGYARSLNVTNLVAPSPPGYGQVVDSSGTDMTSISKGSFASTDYNEKK